MAEENNDIVTKIYFLNVLFRSIFCHVSAYEYF